VIGVPITGDEMAGIFSRLGLAHTRAGHAQDEVFTVTPPSFRFDLEIEEDLIEEVARVWGFERIPAQPPRAVAAMRAPLESERSLHALRHRLAASDFQEVVNFSFVDAAWERDLAGNAAPIQVLNPIASQLAVMRSTLIGGLLDNIRYNVARKQARVRVFEIGRAFLRDPSALEGPVTVAGLHQPIRIAAAAFGAAFEPQWGVAERDVDFFDLKADLEALVAPLSIRCVAAAHPVLHPGRSARVELAGRAIGWIGEIHPRWQAQFELPKPPVVFELDADALQHLKLPRAEQPSRFPAVVRDLAVLVPEATPVQALLDAIEAEKISLIQCVNLFDLYHGKTLPKGQKSLAFRVVMQDTVKTLTDADADAVFAQITTILQQKFNATLRS
jgi:phenylalanyl-tRNA synthetase beta chain